MQRTINGVMLLPPPVESIDHYPERSTEKLRFADTDRNGHVTNSVFAVCCQNARMEVLLKAAGGALPEGTHIAVVRLELDFVGEMHWPGVVEIGTRVARIGRSSVTLAQGLFVHGRCVARSRSVAILMDGATRRSTPLPQDLAAALQAFGPCDEGAPTPRMSLLHRFMELWRAKT